MITKICGISDPRTARVLSHLGIDLIGLVFVKTSPRYISLDQAITIKKAARGSIKTVAVFQNHSLQEVQRIVGVLRPDYIQLHGQESPAYCAALQFPVIKTIHLGTTVKDTARRLEAYKDVCQYFLIDRKAQGHGSLVNLDQVRELSTRYNLFLSGGLTPDNISMVLRNVRDSIIGVDVSSGVENSPGHKDIQKIKRFIKKERFI